MYMYVFIVPLTFHYLVLPVLPSFSPALLLSSPLSYLPLQHLNPDTAVHNNVHAASGKSCYCGHIFPSYTHTLVQYVSLNLSLSVFAYLPLLYFPSLCFSILMHRVKHCAMYMYVFIVLLTFHYISCSRCSFLLFSCSSPLPLLSSFLPLQH